MAGSKWSIVKRTGRSVVIRDEGGRGDKSVRNDAESVVDSLWEQGHLREGMLLFYYDSDGRLDQLRHSSGVFTGYAPGPVDGVVPS